MAQEYCQDFYCISVVVHYINSYISPPQDTNKVIEKKLIKVLTYYNEQE